MHRPQRDVKPWRFDFRGVAEEAYEESENCVCYQLSALLRTRKGQLAFNLPEVEDMIDAIIAKLYPQDVESPYAMEEQNGKLTFRPW